MRKQAIAWANVAPVLCRQVAWLVNELKSFSVDNMGPLLLTWFNFNPRMDK